MNVSSTLIDGMRCRVGLSESGSSRETRRAVGVRVRTGRPVCRAASAVHTLSFQIDCAVARPCPLSVCIYVVIG